MTGLETSMLTPRCGAMSLGGRARPRAAISLRSAPAQKAASPLPVSTSTLAAGSASKARNLAQRPSPTARSMALRASGRLMTSQATSSERRYSTGRASAIAVLRLMFRNARWPAAACAPASLVATQSLRSIVAPQSSRRAALGPLGAHHRQRRAGVDLLALRDQDLADHPGARRGDVVLHLHGLDHHQQGAGLHPLARAGGDPPHHPGQRGGQGAGGGTRGGRLGEPRRLAQRAGAQRAVDEVQVADALALEAAAHS